MGRVGWKLFIAILAILAGALIAYRIIGKANEEFRINSAQYSRDDMNILQQSMLYRLYLAFGQSEPMSACLILYQKKNPESEAINDAKSINPKFFYYQATGDMIVFSAVGLPRQCVPENWGYGRDEDFFIPQEQFGSAASGGMRQTSRMQECENLLLAYQKKYNAALAQLRPDRLRAACQYAASVSSCNVNRGSRCPAHPK